MKCRFLKILLTVLLIVAFLFIVYNVKLIFMKAKALASLTQCYKAQPALLFDRPKALHPHAYTPEVITTIQAEGLTMDVPFVVQSGDNDELTHRLYEGDGIRVIISPASPCEDMTCEPWSFFPDVHTFGELNRLAHRSQPQQLLFAMTPRQVAQASTLLNLKALITPHGATERYELKTDSMIALLYITPKEDDTLYAIQIFSILEPPGHSTTIMINRDNTLPPLDLKALIYSIFSIDYTASLPQNCKSIIE